MVIACLPSALTIKVQLQAKEAIVSALWVKSLPSDKPTRARNQTFLVSSVYCRLIQKEKNNDSFYIKGEQGRKKSLLVRFMLQTSILNFF